MTTPFCDAPSQVQGVVCEGGSPDDPTLVVCTVTCQGVRNDMMSLVCLGQVDVTDTDPDLGLARDAAINDCFQRLGMSLDPVTGRWSRSFCVPRLLGEIPDLAAIENYVSVSCSYSSPPPTCGGG